MACDETPWTGSVSEQVWQGNADRAGQLSFEYVCEALGLEPTCVRRALFRREAVPSLPTSQLPHASG
jgi:hypothetical protein